MSKYHYIGFFLGEDEIQKCKAICEACRKQFLHTPEKECECLKPIGNPHITVQHESDPSFMDDESLFGMTAEVEVVGYGNDGENEALQVRFLQAEDPRLVALIDSAVKRVGEDKVHITVSKSDEGKAVNSRNLKFMPVSGFDRFTLKYSGLLNKQVFDSSKTVSGDLLVFIPYLVKDANGFKSLVENKDYFVKDDVSGYCKYVYGYSYKSSGDDSTKCSIYKSNRVNDNNDLDKGNARVFYFERTNIVILSMLYSFEKTSIKDVSELCRNKRRFKNRNSDKKLRGQVIDDIEEIIFGSELGDNIAEDFFFSAEGQEKRANILLRLDVPLLSYPAYTEADRFYQRKLLYHLRGDGYVVDKFYEPTEQDDKEVWPMDPLKVWGISSSAAVCLTCSQRGNTEHLRDKDKYPKNFKDYYCFLYVYLLHQKYFLYYLCNNISYNSRMDELEKFDKKLTLFSNEYLYKCISDVEQYQGLYERVQEAFNIWEQLEDTQGPFEKLHSHKEKEIESKRSRAESLVNGSLFVLTFLTLASVLCDMFSLDESLRGVINNFDLTNPSYKQTCFVIVALLAFTIISFSVYLIYKVIRNLILKKAEK